MFPPEGHTALIHPYEGLIAALGHLFDNLIDAGALPLQHGIMEFQHGQPWPALRVGEQLRSSLQNFIFAAFHIHLQTIHALEAAITNIGVKGFEVVFESLEGKFKLSQNIRPEDAAGAWRGLEARGDAASLAVADLMRRSR